MADTIRDVVVRVSIENGALALNPPDTSAWMKKFAEMQSVVDKLRADANSITLNPPGTFQGAPTGAQSIADFVRTGPQQTSSGSNAVVDSLRQQFADTQSMINNVRAMQNGGVAAGVRGAQDAGSGEAGGGGNSMWSAVGGAVGQRAGSIASFAAANPQIVALGVAAGAAAVGVKAYLVAVEEARTRFVLDTAAEAQYSRLSATSTGNIRASRIGAEYDKTMARPFLGEDQLRGSHIRSSLNLEENIVSRQAGMRGQGVSESRIGDIRSRSESFEGIRQQQEVENKRAKYLEDQLKALRAQSESIAAERQRTNAEYDRNEKDIRGQALTESRYSTRYTNWFTEMTGGVSNRQASEQRDLINEDLIKSQEKRGISEQGFNEREQPINKSIIQLNRELEDSKIKQVSLTREQLALGQSILDQEKSRTRGEKEAFGSMSLAEQEITRQANEKAKRIELANKEGRETKEELTPIELGLSGSFSNTALGRVGSLQRQRRADESGIFTEQDSANAQLEQQVAAAKEKAGPEITEVSTQLDKLSAENEAAVQKVVDAIEKSFTTKAALEELAKRIAVIETSNRNQQVKNRQWTGG